MTVFTLDGSRRSLYALLVFCVSPCSHEIFPRFQTNMASSVRRSSAVDCHPSDDSESDEDVDFDFDSSSEEDSDDSFNDSESDDEESIDEMIASSRAWCRIDLNNIPARPPRFQFKGSSGLTFTVSSPPQPLELYEAYFDDELLDVIVAETNRYASQLLNSRNLGKHSRFRKWFPVTREELRVCFSLLMLQGIVKKPNERLYWSKSRLIETPAFGEIMPGNRFQLVMRMLHFVDNTTIQNLEGHPQPLLRKIWPVYQELVKKYRTLYVPERDISVDESLLLFKGRLSWKQYMPLKRARFGIKSFLLCESESGYIWNSIIYTGKGTDLETSSVATESFGMATKVVVKLVEPLLDKGYCITTDNFYTSPELVDFLLKRSTDVYGTTRVTRKNLPPGLATTKLKKGDMLAFQRGKCLLIQWKDKKLVTVLSTVHSAEMVPFIDKRGNQLMKPEAILDYNHRMGGVDRADQMLSSYSVPRKRKKISYKKIFQHLLDEATYNSFVLYQKEGGRASHMDYRLQLVDEIITKYSGNGSAKKKGRPGCPLNMKRLTERHFPSHIPPTEKKREPTRRCIVCYMKRDSKGKNIRKETRIWCRWCEKALCAVPCFERYHTVGSLQ